MWYCDSFRFYHCKGCWKHYFAVFLYLLSSNFNFINRKFSTKIEPKLSLRNIETKKFLLIPEQSLHITFQQSFWFTYIVWNLDSSQKKVLKSQNLGNTENRNLRTTPLNDSAVRELPTSYRMEWLMLMVEEQRLEWSIMLYNFFKTFSVHFFLC